MVAALLLDDAGIVFDRNVAKRGAKASEIHGLLHQVVEFTIIG